MLYLLWKRQYIPPWHEDRKETVSAWRLIGWREDKLADRQLIASQSRRDASWQKQRLCSACRPLGSGLTPNSWLIKLIKKTPNENYLKKACRCKYEMFFFSFVFALHLWESESASIKGSLKQNNSSRWHHHVSHRQRKQTAVINKRLQMERANDMPGSALWHCIMCRCFVF